MAFEDVFNPSAVQQDIERRRLERVSKKEAAKAKEDRDRISKAVMEDPQLKESMDPSKMPFDGKRMFWGGFQTIVGLGAGK